ncbi:LLM class flavin-dependent oxidoreductase [Streptomyces sp. NPDC005573]|uniref:LLM class flavin-dependent oxidoreductase n=1 Tax=Streptomyces sp. NPDC005573 TaxID=3156890 RepID=UPI0033B2FC0D
MKVTLFEQAPYRSLPADFEEHHDSACTTPYGLTDRAGVYSSVVDHIDELMTGARAGFDGISMTEHGQSSYDLSPNPNLVASALAYATETEKIDTAIFPMGRSLGKTREPVRVAEEYAMVDVISGGRLIAGFPVGLSYDASLNNGIPPMQVRGRFEENLELVLRAWRDRDPFAWNGRYGQFPQVNIWPRPLQEQPPVWITGIGNPRTMQLTLERGFGFNYFGFAGAKLTGKRIFDRFWELSDRLGLERNPYRMGFLQTIAVSETDAAAEKEYGRHVEYAYRKGLGAIPPEMLGLPGGVNIHGVKALLKDPGDFGMYATMRTARFRELADAGTVIIGSPATVRDQLVEYCTTYGIGNLHAMLGFGSMPKDLVQKNIHLFATEVLPHLRTLWQDKGHVHHWWPERLGGVPLAAPEQNTPSAAERAQIA